MLRVLVFWDDTLCSWVKWSWHFKMSRSFKSNAQHNMPEESSTSFLHHQNFKMFCSWLANSDPCIKKKCNKKEEEEVLVVVVVEEEEKAYDTIYAISPPTSWILCQRHTVTWVFCILSILQCKGEPAQWIWYFSQLPIFYKESKVMVASHLGADLFMLPLTNVQTVHWFSLN
jgi:hypothetical protein